ncbi:MAG: hypothetical protein DRI57_05965 [Deltaproteobacteria bacterium]|nr:MAG: hypothetical protein DRI57_05965 [Deltaproteobacteria bacterium]
MIRTDPFLHSVSARIFLCAYVVGEPTTRAAPLNEKRLIITDSGDTVRIRNIQHYKYPGKSFPGFFFWENSFHKPRIDTDERG